LCRRAPRFTKLIFENKFIVFKIHHILNLGRFSKIETPAKVFSPVQQDKGAVPACGTFSHEPSSPAN